MDGWVTSAVHGYGVAGSHILIPEGKEDWRVMIRTGGAQFHRASLEGPWRDEQDREPGWGW